MTHLLTWSPIIKVIKRTLHMFSREIHNKIQGFAFSLCSLIFLHILCMYILIGTLKLQVFIKEAQIKSYTRHGEARAADTLEGARDQFQQILTLAHMCLPSDVFNMDDTGLFYKLGPKRTLVTHQLSGNKQHKEHIVIALTANMDDTMKLLPFVINHLLRP